MINIIIIIIIIITPDLSIKTAVSKTSRPQIIMMSFTTAFTAAFTAAFTVLIYLSYHLKTFKTIDLP